MIDKINNDDLCPAMVYVGKVYKAYWDEPCALIYGTTIDEVNNLYKEYKKQHQAQIMEVYTPCDWWDNRELIKTIV